MNIVVFRAGLSSFFKEISYSARRDFQGEALDKDVVKTNFPAPHSLNYLIRYPK